MLTDQEQEGFVVFLLFHVAPAAFGIMACAVLALPVEEALIDRIIVVLRPLGKILVVLVQSNPEELSIGFFNWVYPALRDESLVCSNFP